MQITEPEFRRLGLVVEKTLFACALTEWEAEKKINYERIKSFASPDALAFVQAICSLTHENLQKILSLLPKRSRIFLREVEPNFFPPEEQRVVDNFVKELSMLAMPFFPGHEKVTNIWEEHDALVKMSRGAAMQIEKRLIGNLEERCKELSGYVFTRSEPHVVSYERQLGDFRIDVDFDFRPWKFFCGLKVFRPNGPSLVSNYTFLGSLGISSGPAWYVDESSALKALTVCVDHALEASRAVASIFSI
jgi:hypothetical protein